MQTCECVKCKMDHLQLIPFIHKYSYNVINFKGRVQVFKHVVLFKADWQH